MSKTILQICPQLNSGGIECGTVEIAKALKQSGYESLVASAGGCLEQELQQAGVEHIRLPLHKKQPFSIYQNSKKLAELIATRNIDLVHASSRAPIWCAVLAKKRCSFPLITACHGLHGKGWLKLKKLYNRGITYGDKIIAISNCVSDYLQQEYSVPLDKIAHVFLGVDDIFFEENNDIEQTQNLLSSKFGIPADKKMILMPGRITRWKGQHVFLQAFAKLSRQSNAIAVVVGRVDSHQYSKELRTFVDREGLGDRVFFMGDFRDMLKLYTVADIVVSASTKPESFGRVMVESQAVGRGITVATDLGGSRETIIAGETGFLVKPGCSIALQQAIQTSLDLDEDKSMQMRRRARQHMKQHFSKKAMLGKMQNLYGQFVS